MRRLRSLELLDCCRWCFRLEHSYANFDDIETHLKGPSAPLVD